MKNLTQSKSFILLFLIVVVACSSDTDLQPLRSYLDNIIIENGIAVFEDHDAFNNATIEVAKFSTDELNKWEKTSGFISKRTKIQQAINELTNPSDIKGHKDDVNDYISYDHDGNLLGLAFPLPRRAILVNENGLVKVGSDLLVFKNDRVITIVGGDATRLKEAELLSKSSDDKSILISWYIKSEQVHPNGRSQTTGNDVLCYQPLTTGRGFFRIDCRWTIYDMNNGHPVVQAWYYEVGLTALNVHITNVQHLALATFDLNYQSVKVTFSHLAGGGLAHIFRTPNIE